MYYQASQIINGIVDYADNEVMNKLPTMGKWIVGTGVGIASVKASELVNALSNNTALHTLGIVNDDGEIDIDTIADNMKGSATKYGKAMLEIPFVGKLTFCADDIEILKEYIKRGK